MYLVCEPPGDPYYLCRLMEFLHVDSDNPNSPIDSIRVNWYYRPRDVQRFNSDTRLVYGTMHSDLCPLTSLRGKCIIKHRSDIEDLELYRKDRDSFYFVQVFDRFIRRWYECIPVAQIINVPERVKKALDDRGKFVVVEVGRVKELTSAVKTCKRCTRYCASSDSVDCAICKHSYHMNCVQPPLPKKPSRGFAWACGPCSRASERKLEIHGTPVISEDVTEADEEEVAEEDPLGLSNDTTRAPSPSADDMAIDDHPATQAEIALAKMWPMRYLGIHARVEDALQYDDRAIYPRASSRLGPRHQANVNVWHDHIVELVKPAEIKKRYNKNPTKKDGKLTKETVAAIEADREERAKRPKWVQDEPPGYIVRGEDYDNDDPRCTAKLIFKMPERQQVPQYTSQGQTMVDEIQYIDHYVAEAKKISRNVGVPPFGVNFLDKALQLFASNRYDFGTALDALRRVDRSKDLHEPVLTRAELTKFEEGVAKYGSEHRLVRLHMKTNLPNADIVRFYYLWKKTPKGKEIWGNFGGRKGSKRKVDSDTGARLQAEVAHDGDDSAFDNGKAVRHNRGFQCKFCNTNHSRQWRKAPFVAAGQTVPVDTKAAAKDKKQQRLLYALCLRCAGLWRKYAIQWEDIDDVSKKVAQGGGKALKRRIDEELLREIIAANEAASMPVQDPALAVPSIEGTGEPLRKKPKTDTAPPEAFKKKPPPPPPPPKEPTPPPPPIIPAQPTWKVLPCAICRAAGDTIACGHCRLTVHRQCFGVAPTDGVRSDGSVNWVCEQCQNDRNPSVSTDYACCLCLTEETLIDLVEPPKVSHKKKTDREREKERLEKELADNMRMEYRNKQMMLNRAMTPREPLKRTTGNNWVHVSCAVWMPEIRFSNAKIMEVAEGFQSIPPAKYDAICKLCKNRDHLNVLRENAGACVSCLQCHANFHASCAFEAGYQFGFDVTPVKGSRKDQVTTATLGDETGSLVAAIWCKEHVIKTIMHPVNEFVDKNGRTALQVFVENCKQADLTLTGTVRKANLAQLVKEKGQQAPLAGQISARRESTANSIAAAVRRGARTSLATDAKPDEETGTEVSALEALSERQCKKCKIDVTPKWHSVLLAPPPAREPTPPQSPKRRLSMTLGEYADLERQRSEAHQVVATTEEVAEDVSGSTAVPPTTESVTEQGVHTTVPGATGANEAPAEPEIQPLSTERATSTVAVPDAQSVVPSKEEAMPDANGDGSRDGVYHSGGLPQFQNPADTTPPPEDILVVDEPTEYLCHKCFVKAKLDPTPPPRSPSPPPPPAPPAELSPPHQFPLQLNWNRQPEPSYSTNPGMSWNDPQRHSQPPTPGINGNGTGHPQINGLGPMSAYGPHAVHGPPPPSVNYQVAHPQTNGYTFPSPVLPQSMMHHRRTSYGEQQQQQQPQQNHYPQWNYPPRPPPIHSSVYAPPGPPMTNGLNSPNGVHRHVASPTYPGAPPMHQFPPRRTESPFSTQLQPIGGPLHSSPRDAFAGLVDPMLTGLTAPLPPPQAAPLPYNNNQQQTQQQQQQISQVDPQLTAQSTAYYANQQMSQMEPAAQSTPYYAPQQISPIESGTQTNPYPPLSQVDAADQTGAGAQTPPRDEQANATGGIGASASPSLRNLLH